MAVIEEAVEAQHALEEQLRRTLHLNPTDFRALMLITRRRRRGVACRPGDLTRAFGLSSSAAAQITARLHRAGLLQRTDDPSDARAGLLEPTALADERIAAATADLRHDLDQFLDTLGEEEEQQLVRLLDAARDIFHHHRNPAPHQGTRTARAG